MALADSVYTQLAFKASHNSYSMPPVVRHLAWTSSKPHRAGCRGVELDVIQKADGWEWSVRHEKPWIEDEEAQLRTYLHALSEWSAGGQRRHDVLMVHINLKNSALPHDEFPEAFDAYVLRAMRGAEIFTPGDLLGGATTDLLTAAREHGWPTLAELYGQFIFCLTGHEDDRTDEYTRRSTLAQRVCFCDTEVEDPTKPEIPHPSFPNRVIYNFAPYYHRSDWVEAIANVGDRDAILIRAFDVNDALTWRRTREAGVNIIATDQVFLTKWAHVGPLLFVPRSAGLRRVPMARPAGVPERAGIPVGRAPAAGVSAEELAMEDLARELRRLRRENGILREERKILTRALAVVAREPLH